ncbi:MAG TPA: hypothetical protein VGE88_07085 [Lysobacter sp.]
MSNPPNDGAPAGGTPAADAGAGGAPNGSAFSAVADAGGQGGAPAGGEAPKPLHERIPEKYRVTKEDGSLDLEASADKLLGGYGSLEQRLGTGELPPKDADGYDPKPEGFDMEALKKDPDYQSFLKGAHAKGLTNAQVEFVLSQYAGSAAMTATPPMSAAEFQAEMTTNHWKEPGEYEKQMGLGLRAIRAYMPDITAEEINTLPNHPIIAKILAKVGAETAEDRGVTKTVISDADFDSQLAALQASEPYNNASHPEHKATVDKVSKLFEQRYKPAA